MLDAGFSAVEIVDARADLNVYAKIDNQAGCCSPPMARDLPVASGCCAPTLHNELADLLRRYDVNEFAASVKVFAVKPR